MATEFCKKNRVLIDHSPVKASREVSVGIRIMIRKNQIHYTYKVLDIPKNRVGAKLVGLYLKDETSFEELEKLRLILESQKYYRQMGIGRPTKRDRRDIDDFFDIGEMDTEE